MRATEIKRLLPRHDLESRGLPIPYLVISDGNPGLIKAIREVWPDVPKQRCIVHRTRNIPDKMPKSLHDEARKALNRIWYAEDLDASIAAAKAFVKKYGRSYKSAVDCLLEGLPDCLTFFRFPEEYWKRIRTSNPLERTFKEVRRRTKVVGRFPSESSALAVIYGILSIEAGKWRGLTFGPTTVIELHQVSENLKTEPI